MAGAAVLDESRTVPELRVAPSAHLFVVLHVQVVLVSVLVAAGQRDEGDGVDGLHQRSLRQSLGHHLAAKVRHGVPDGRHERRSQPAAGSGPPYQEDQVSSQHRFMMRNLNRPHSTLYIDAVTFVKTL